jgi:mannose-6-phosphate isomerase
MLPSLLRFTPHYKTVIWGGNKIGAYKGVETGADNVGESWEISSVLGHESLIADGPFKGLTIGELTERFTDSLVGTDVYRRHGDHFPLLVKIIDANANLSVQVHPNDTLARMRHKCPGKSEMWYVIDCEPDARIYCGLSEALTPEGYDRRIANDTIMQAVKSHRSMPGQFYYIPAGTLHAIGAGNLIAEIQQASDITYRVYDYDRLDADGKPRELHTAEAREAIDYTYPSNVHPAGEIIDTPTRGAVSSDYFTVDYLTGRNHLSGVVHNGESFVIVMVTRGRADIIIQGERHRVDRGNTVLVPAIIHNFDILINGDALLVKA